MLAASRTERHSRTSRQRRDIRSRDTRLEALQPGHHKRSTAHRRTSNCSAVCRRGWCTPFPNGSPSHASVRPLSGITSARGGSSFDAFAMTSAKRETPHTESSATISPSRVMRAMSSYCGMKQELAMANHCEAPAATRPAERKWIKRLNGAPGPRRRLQLLQVGSTFSGCE